jgi:hypothetical protein
MQDIINIFIIMNNNIEDKSEYIQEEEKDYYP